jgi:hypothetical protein
MSAERDAVRAMPATNATELRARMAAAGSGFGATCPECGANAAPAVLAYFGGVCMACKA